MMSLYDRSDSGVSLHCDPVSLQASREICCLPPSENAVLLNLCEVWHSMSRTEDPNRRSRIEFALEN